MQLPPGRFLNLCGDYYSVVHRRKLHDKIPSVPCLLAAERQINPIFRSLRQRASTVLNGITSMQQQQQLLQQQQTHSQRDQEAMELNKPMLANLLPLHLTDADDFQKGNAGGNKQIALQKQEDNCVDAHGEEEEPQNFVMGPRRQEFAFLYRSELDVLCKSLRSGELSALQAADRLMELERSVFQTPVLTGGEDSFDDEGIDTPASDPASGNLADATTEEETPANDVKALKERRRQLAYALHVLGVPAAMPVGRKAPCSEDKFPVSVPRLVCLLERLGVPQLSLETLKLAFASALSQSPEDSRSVQQLMPLKEVLDLICPLPEQPGRLLRCWKAIQKCALCCRCRCPCGRGSVESSTEDQQTSGQLQDQSSNERRLIAKQEANFSKHNVRKCVVCSGSFSHAGLKLRRPLGEQCI